MLPRLLALALAAHIPACAATEASPREGDASRADAGDAVYDAAGAAHDVGDPRAVIPIGDDADAGPCTWSPRRCGSRSQLLELTAGSPIGPLHVQSVGVYYWNGFTVGTGLWFEGTVAGQTFTLSADRANEVIDGGLRAATAVGRYGSGNSWSDLYARLATCDRALELHEVELVIERHDVPDLIQTGASIRLEGRLVVSDPGWTFAVSFSIEQVCEVNLGS